MKFQTYIITALAASILLSSCDNYLDLKPISEETTASAYTTASQLEAALTGTYESFQSNEYYVWDNVIFSEVRSDNYYAGGDNAEIFEFDNLKVAPTNSRLYNRWASFYDAIKKANTVLQQAPLVDDPKLTDERRQQIMGEAYFLRAYQYFNMVKLWGGVPLVLAPISSTDPSAVRIPRATVDEVYDQILTDLDMAAQMLPDAYGTDASVNKARATAGAANAIAAKVCLQRPTPNYTEALSYIDKVEKSSANYKLIPYNDLFDGNHYNNDESILEIQYTGGPEGNYGPQLLLPPSISGDTWRKFVTPSHNLVEAFDAEGDEVRKNASILFESAPWVDEYWGNVKGSVIPFGYKWKNASGWASKDRQYIVRFGDIILLKAEALNAQGNTSDAVKEVDKIRLRAGLEGLSADKYSSQEVLKSTILNERRLELAQEAQRWDDLVRFGVAVSTMQNLEETDLRTNQLVDYPMTEAKILLPIPQQEIDRNPSLVQNPL